MTPARGARNAWRFSFQDLIVLRTARSLVEANVPQRRIVKAIRELRRNLPESMPLSGLRIGAEGDRVVVREGSRRWQADSGQYLLAFEGNPAQGTLGVVECPPEPPPAAEADWYSQAVALESQDVPAAVRAYGRALAENQRNADAYLNLGRLLHEAGHLPEAERIYRVGIKACPGDARLHYNLGVLHGDRGRRPEAIAAYVAAVRLDPKLADGHYNLALLYEEAGKPRDAIRHMARYRKLAGS